MRLNVMCGRHVLNGWTNVDIVRAPLAERNPDIMSDAKAIPLPDACARELMVIHGFEHFYPWEAELALSEWRRLLQPGGLLVLELPDLLKCCRNVLEGAKGRGHPDQLGMWGLYGDPRDEDPYMMHRWGWSPATLSDFLSARGFTNIREKPTEWHRPGKLVRDMRIEAVKHG